VAALGKQAGERPPPRPRADDDDLQRSSSDQIALSDREKRYAFAFEMTQKCVEPDADAYTGATEDAARRCFAAGRGGRDERRTADT
jgi:hypothetical protein